MCVQTLISRQTPLSSLEIALTVVCSRFGDLACLRSTDPFLQLLADADEVLDGLLEGRLD